MRKSRINTSLTALNYNMFVKKKKKETDFKNIALEKKRTV